MSVSVDIKYRMSLFRELQPTQCAQYKKDKVSPVLNSADLLVLPSRYD